jgi:hypothetical protein
VLAGRGGRQQHGVVVQVGGDGAGCLLGEQPVSNRMVRLPNRPLSMTVSRR